MAKQNLLLVDADLRSVRVLEVSLRKAGYNVASAGNGKDALAMLELSRPDLVLCDTRLPVMDGFELIQEMRGRPELAGIPLMILSSDVSVETKVRGLELGIEDYLTKPIYIKELLARVNIVLQRKRREGIERLEQGNKRKFSGSLSDMGVVDLLQTIDHSKKSGVLYLTSGRFEGAIYFCNGAPVDAAVGRLRGSRAIYRTLLWTDGTFEIDFREIDREDHVQTSMQAVLMEGLRRVDEWGRLLEQLPNLDTVFDVSDTQLMARLAEIPDQINSVLREFDGQRSLWEIVDACDADDLETLNAVSKLYFEGLLYNTGRSPSDAVMDIEPEQRPELDMSLPHISSGPPVITHTLAPAWGSVPSADGSQTELVDDTLQLNIPATPKLPDGLRITPSEAPKRRKGRKRKKRNAKSLPAEAKPAQAQADDVRVVDESVAEITPSTIAPPPEDAENAAIVQADQADVPTVNAPGTSTPPQLPRSRPVSVTAGTTTPPDLPRPSQAAVHDSPTLDLSPIRSFGTPPPLQRSARPPLSAAAPEPAEPALKSTAPPPLSSQAAPPGDAQAFNSDEATTERQGSIPPRHAESYIPRNAASPPPLPYVSKPPSPGFGSHRGVTSPGFAAAPADEETIAAAAAAISEAETAPPPLAADASEARSSRRAGTPSEASRAGSARADASVPARDFEAAILASIPPPSAADAESDTTAISTPPHEYTVTAGWPNAAPEPDAEASASAIPARSESPPPLSAASTQPDAAEPDAPREAAASTPPEPSDNAQPSETIGEPPHIEPAQSQDLSAPQGARLSSTATQAAGSLHPEQPTDADDSTAFDEPSRVASARPRALSAPPPAATSAPANAREVADDSATFDETASVAAARAREISAPPGAAASAPTATREDADESAAFDEGRSAPPVAAASTPAEAREGADDSAASDEATDATPEARDFSAPPLAAASVSPAAREGDDSAFDEASGIADAQVPSFSASALAAASVPPAAREGGDDMSGAAEALARSFGAPPLAAASVAPVAREGGGELSGAAEALARSFGAPPLAAGSVAPAVLGVEETSRGVADRALDLSAPTLAGAGAEEHGEGVDASAVPGVALDSLAPMRSGVPANDVDLPKPEEDFSELDVAARSGNRGAPPPLPPVRSRSAAPRTRTSPPPLPGSRTRTDLESGPALATASAPPPSAAAMSSTLPGSEDSRTDPGGYVAIQPDIADDADDQSKRIRAPVHRTEVPPPFEPNATPPSAMSVAANDSGEAQPPSTVELAQSSEPPRISTVTSSVRPDITKNASDRAASERREEPDSIAAKVREAAAHARSESASAKARDAAPQTSDAPVSARPSKTSNVISFVPRKRAEDAAASGKPLPPGEAAQGAWVSTSSAPGAADTSPPRTQRKLSRWVQAGGAAATVALAAGLFALRARDTAPQGSLNTAVPEAAETKPVTQPSAAAGAEQQALGELEALNQQAQATPEAPKPSTPSAAPTAPGMGAAQQASAEPTARAPQQPTEAAQKPASDQPDQPANAPTEAAQKPASDQPATPEQQAAQPQTDKPADAQASAAQTLAKGLSLEKRGKKQDAINLYAKAVEEGHASSQLLSRMAFLYLNQGKNALAEASAKRAADEDETNSEAWIVLGAALDAQGKKPAAEQAYRSCAQKGQGQYVTECKRMLR